MKAKKFRRLRKKVKVYLVLKSKGEIGIFSAEKFMMTSYQLANYTEVIARYSEEAARRFMKRIHAVHEFSRYDFEPEQIDEPLAKLEIFPKHTREEKFITYWR